MGKFGLGQGGMSTRTAGHAKSVPAAPRDSEHPFQKRSQLRVLLRFREATSRTRAQRCIANGLHAPAAAPRLRSPASRRPRAAGSSGRVPQPRAAHFCAHSRSPTSAASEHSGIPSPPRRQRSRRRPARVPPRPRLPRPPASVSPRRPLPFRCSAQPQLPGRRAGRPLRPHRRHPRPEIPLPVGAPAPPSPQPPNVGPCALTACHPSAKPSQANPTRPNPAQPGPTHRRS